MKLIKINDNHYVIVDDSEIKEGDWFYANQGLRQCIRVENNTSCPYITLNDKGEEIGHFRTWRGIVTHSTQPLEEFVDNEGIRRIGWVNIKVLELSEIKELIGEVDVEKKAEESFPIIPGTHPNINWDRSNLQEGFITGYNQAIEDNKDKKYTEEDLNYLLNLLTYDDLAEDEKIESCIEYIKDLLQLKTEWEVEIVDGKLKLK